jgi:dTDP-4-amino-4,6-dideoxygalactose transaminase
MVTDNEELYRKRKMYRVHGSAVIFQHVYIGLNSRLDTLQAAILRVKLTSTDQAIALRAKHAAHYTERLSTIQGLESREYGATLTKCTMSTIFLF